MSKKGGVPDAWDDDWVAVADKPEATIAQPEPAPKLTKTQRRAQHLDQQKQLWDSAENPDRFHWLEAQGVVPLKQEVKPQVTLLSRKPAAPVIAKNDTTNGVASLNLGDEDDSEEEAQKKRAADLQERQRIAKIEREEKQRKYAEARERIMGASNPTSPAPASRDSSHSRDSRKTKAKLNGNRGSQPTSTDQSPAPPQNSHNQLFDPDYMGRTLPKRDSNSSIPKEDQPSRQPSGPESSGRGGFGFAVRGGAPIS